MTAGKRRAAFSLLALLTAALLFASCGNAAKDPRETLDAAVRAARDAGSAQASLMVSVSPLEEGKGMSLDLEGDVWVDLEGDAVEARFMVMGMEASLRYVEGEAFLQIGGTWYALEGEIAGGIGASAVGAAFEVLPSLPELLSSAREVEHLEDREVSGCDCAVLEVVPDLQAVSSARAVRELARELGMSEEEVREYLEGADLSLQAYVQKGESVLRQVSLAASVELPSLDELVGLPLLPRRARLEMTLYFAQYGVEVEVRAPAGAVPFAGL